LIPQGFPHFGLKHVPQISAKIQLGFTPSVIFATTTKNRVELQTPVDVELQVIPHELAAVQNLESRETLRDLFGRTRQISGTGRKNSANSMATFELLRENNVLC